MTGCLLYGITMNLNTPTLTEKMSEKGIKNITNPHIVIIKESYTLQLYSDSVLVKEYPVVRVRIRGEKSILGDKATPVGVYSICDIDTTGPYGIMMYLNYPNLNDISESFRVAELTQQEFERRKFEYYYQDCPESNAPVSQRIGIHGIGQLNFVFKKIFHLFLTGQNGSVVLSDEGMRELFSIIRRGTPVVIKEEL